VRLLLPVIVKLYVPAGVVLLVFTVNVDEPLPVTLVGVNVGLAPDGRPLTLKPTVPLKPFKAETETVYVVPEPAVTVRDDGVALIEKSGDGAWAFTVSVAEAVCVRPPPVPVIVRL